MLILVTGLPGAGKSLYTISTLLKKYRGRRIFTYGIPGIDHEALGTEDLADPELWYECVEGSVIVIDEAQKVFPVRAAGRPVPRKCSEFETHRHKGFDVILMTQDATTLDTHLRKLCGQHLHVHRLFGGHTANVYEYPTFEARPTDKKTQKGAMGVKLFKYPKAAFGLYKSADLHTVKRKYPVKLILVVAAMLAAVVYIGWAVFYFASGHLMETEAEQVQTQGLPGEAKKAKSSKGADGVIYSVEEYAKLMSPLIEGVPHSAPFYQSVYKAVDFPKPYCVIIGDLSSPTDCKCFSQQMTRYETSMLLCQHYAVAGFFDPTRAPESAANRAEHGGALQAAGESESGR